MTRTQGDGGGIGEEGAVLNCWRWNHQDSVSTLGLCSVKHIQNTCGSVVMQAA